MHHKKTFRNQHRQNTEQYKNKQKSGKIEKETHTNITERIKTSSLREMKKKKSSSKCKNESCVRERGELTLCDV